MKLLILVLFSLLNTFNLFEISTINSFQETKINLNETQRYVIFEFLSESKNIHYQYFSVIPYPTLHIYFKKGYQINTNFYIYYNKEDIQLENNKFINSFYNDDLYEKNKTWIDHVKSGKIYIVISNYKSNYEDAITIFNDLEYYDISKINKIHYDIYYNNKINAYTYDWVTFSINNTNLNYSYLHHEGWGIRYIQTDDGISVKESNNIISLKENKNKIIYLFFFYSGYAYYHEHSSIDFETSNYSLLYPLTDIENRTFSHEILGENSKHTYLFINITDYPPTFYVNISHQMNIFYYLFETDDFELIETKIPFKEKGNQANTKELYFSIQKKDNSSIGLVLDIYTKDYIFLSIDFKNKTPEQDQNKTNTTNNDIHDNSDQKNNKVLISVISILGGIFIIIGCVCYCYFKNKNDNNNKDEDYLLQRPIYKNKNDHIDDIIYNINDSYNDDNNDIIENVNYIKGDNNTITNNNIINKETNIDNHIELNKCKIENNENTQNNIINNNIIINIGNPNQVNDAKEILDSLMKNNKKID